MTSDAAAGRGLTPRAEETLNSLIAEFRAEILSEAERRSVGNEVGVRDVLEAFEDVSSPRRGALESGASRLATLLGVYAAIAAVLSLVAVVTLLRDSISPIFSTVLLTGSATLVGASVASLFSAKSRLDRAARERVLARTADRGAGALLERWVLIESGLRSLAADALGSSAAELPLGQLLSALDHAKVIKPTTVGQIKSVLQMRNEVVHNVIPEKNALTRSIAEADSVLANIDTSRGKTRF